MKNKMRPSESGVRSQKSAVGESLYRSDGRYGPRSALVSKSTPYSLPSWLMNSSLVLSGVRQADLMPEISELLNESVRT